MIFIENKYYRTYRAIIENALHRTLTGYYETHHIIPRSLGGTDNNENLIRLTAREHFICHLLLPKFTEGPDRYKMLHAFIMMSGRSVYKSRAYDMHRREYSALMRKRMSGDKNHMFGVDRSGVKNTFYGKQHSDETKLKISTAKKGTSYGKGIPKSEEHKKKLSAARKGTGAVYLFENKDGTLFEGTAAELSKLVGSQTAEVYKLAAGEYKTHKGWTFKNKVC